MIPLRLLAFQADNYAWPRWSHFLSREVIEPLAGDAFTWPLLWPLWMLASWWCVCRLYLKIRHAFFTALLLLVMALLLTLIVGYPLGFFHAFIDWTT